MTRRQFRRQARRHPIASAVEQARADRQDITHAETAIDAMHRPLFDLGGVR